MFDKFWWAHMKKVNFCPLLIVYFNFFYEYIYYIYTLHNKHYIRFAYKELSNNWDEFNIETHWTLGYKDFTCQNFC